MDYIEEEGRDPDDERKAKLEAFASMLCMKGKEAIDARKLSGIEAQWQEDETCCDDPRAKLDATTSRFHFFDS